MSPARVAWLAAWLAVLLALAAGASGAVRVVDGAAACPGDGTSAAPWCRIGQAVGQLACGDTVRIRQTEAPYDEVVRFTAPSCTAGRPILIEPDLYQEPVWTSTTHPGGWTAALHLLDVSYWTLRGLTFDGGDGLRTPRSAVRVEALTQPVVGVQLLGLRVAH